MGIWPHPDDEAYLSAGLMARMTDAGRSVTVLTLTRGEKGTSDPADYDQPHFAAHRERELRASLAEAGVHDVRVVGDRDGECDLVDAEAAISCIADVIASVGPDLLVTFGPDGITGHRDHRIVSAWVTEAWRRVGGTELLYAAMSDDFVARHADLHDRPVRRSGRRRPCLLPARPDRPRLRALGGGARSQATRSFPPRQPDRPPRGPDGRGHLPPVVAHRVVPSPQRAGGVELRPLPRVRQDPRPGRRRSQRRTCAVRVHPGRRPDVQLLVTNRRGNR
jgi:LmbE family N-acetylglucosaminyl deacetylase